MVTRYFKPRVMWFTNGHTVINGSRHELILTAQAAGTAGMWGLKLLLISLASGLFYSVNLTIPAEEEGRLEVSTLNLFGLSRVQSQTSSNLQSHSLIFYFSHIQ